MILFRIGKTKYAKDLSGDGAKLYGGRWNHEGIPCIYTAATRSLSLLEYTVHVSLDTAPPDLSFSSFEVPSDSIKKIKIDEMPANWKEWPHPKQTRDFGTSLLVGKKYLILKIPSAIIPDEFNYIINTTHARMNEVKIIEVRPFIFDTRLVE